MLLSPKMEEDQTPLSRAPLTLLTFSDEASQPPVVTPAPTPRSLSSVLPSHTGAFGSLCFVLADLAKSPDFEGFAMFGVVKEAGVDDAGLSEFYHRHFPFPLYRDDKWVFYNDFFGRKKIGLRTWNPLQMYRGYKEMMARVKGKKIKGNLAGEGMVQGGLVLFGVDGKAKYAYEEEVGKELEMEDVVKALEAIKAEANKAEANND
ncbi:hypothetical protein ACHAXS_003779 [Conticribra weissflogii]